VDGLAVHRLRVDAKPTEFSSAFQEGADAIVRIDATAMPPIHDNPFGPCEPTILREPIAQLRSGHDLTQDLAQGAFTLIMQGSCPDGEIAELLMLLAMRPPTVDEIVGAATAMRAVSSTVQSGLPPESILDTAGTGGTPKSFNASTGAALVAAACGVHSAKHGNRSRTGRGSAEVLQSLGFNLACSRFAQATMLQQVRFCFCFAVEHHPAARHAVAARRALPFPTLFNLVGPLTNPAGARRQMIGVWHPMFMQPMAQALERLGVEHAVVLHSRDGLDEISIGAPTDVVEVGSDGIRSWVVDPAALGIDPVDPLTLAPTSVEQAADVLRSLLDGRRIDACHDMLALNAAMALRVGGAARDLREGLDMARRALQQGGGAHVLAKACELSHH
jgi:anthranilate phosphoribosyltransferase